MDTDDRKRRRSLIGWALTLMFCLVLLAWIAYDYVIVQRNPLLLFSDRYASFFQELVLVFIILILFYLTYTRKIPFRPGKSPAPIPPGIESAPVSQYSGFFSPSQWRIISLGSLALFALFYMENVYAHYHSLPLSAGYFVVFIACCGIARLLSGAPEIRWMISGILTFIAFLFYMILAEYLFTPVFLPGAFLSRIAANPAALIFWIGFTGILLAISWISAFGFPFFRLTDDQLQERYRREVVIPHPVDKAFPICREAVLALPNAQIITEDPVLCTLTATVSPGWGRGSSVRIDLEPDGDRKTKVAIDVISPVPGPDEPRKRMHVNRKYLQVLETLILQSE